MIALHNTRSDGKQRNEDKTERKNCKIVEKRNILTPSRVRTLNDKFVDSYANKNNNNNNKVEENAKELKKPANYFKVFA